MKIVILGAGGIGGFYGALLQRAGIDVRFVARGATLEELKTNGITVESPLGDFSLPVVACHATCAEIDDADFIIVCVKRQQTEAVLDDLAPGIENGATVVTFQNGLDQHAIFDERFGSGRTIVGVPIVSVHQVAPGKYRHLANGQVVFGEPDGSMTDRLDAITAAFAGIGLPIEKTPAIRFVLWRKLLWNAAFNPVTYLTERSSHEILRQPETNRVIRRIMAEAVAVAQAEGIPLTNADAEGMIAQTLALPDIVTSMLVDRQHGRSIEVEEIPGEVVHRGEKHGIPTPTVDTIYSLLKLMQA